MKTQVMLNVAALCSKSHVNGPGTRSVIWVQGCHKRCLGCINLHMQPFKAAEFYDPRKLANQLCQITETNGITLSGGEPFEQPRACGILAETAKKQGKTVMAFSGYEYDQLITWQNPHIQHFLGQIDMLICGPYKQKLACESRLWQASSNQTVHFLTDKMETFLPWKDQEAVEFNVKGDDLIFTGFPETEDIQWLDQILNPV